MAMVLDGLVSALMGKLVDAGIKKIASILNVESDMEALESNMESIRLVLVDAKSKKIEENSINHWLAKLREVAYDVEDLLDDFTAAKLGKSESVRDTTLSIPWRFRGKNNSSTSKSVKDTILSFPGVSQMAGIPMKNEISTRIKNINSNLTKIYSKAPTLQLLANLPDADKKVSSQITDTCSIQLDSDVVGIDDDATTDLVNLITGDSNQLIAITGMSGIGKTTLARKVFNHKLIEKHFDNTVWVCVSSNRSGEDLLKEIIRSFDKNYSWSGVTLNELSSKLNKVIKEKRVFIVLDDIWKSDVWEKFLRVPLLKGENYIRILITTRNEKVAKEMKIGINHTHRMTEMNLSDGWSMLSKIVFNEEKDKGDMNELEKVGKEIVDRCKGLPLAIKVVGGVLNMTDRTTGAWTRVLSSTTWSMQDLPEDIPPSLLLSYEDLPLHLKQCFAYCSLFPEDYEISQFNLEHLWIVEGFIEKVKEKEVEYSAKEYYNELVMRNLLQVLPWDIHEESKSKMHDLLRSLAIYVSQKQYIYLKPQDFHKNGLTRRHHLSFIGNDKNDEEVSQEIKEEDRVRTLLLSNNRGFTKVSSELLSSLRWLRVLDLQGTGIETLPDSLGDLIHLRFLNVSYTKLRELPDSIRKLKNLETLEATVLDQLRSLPMGISELFNLRCLRVSGVRFDKMPNGLDNMKNLRILDRFVVNDRTSSEGPRYTPNLKELKDLSQLTELCISKLNRVTSKEEAEEAAIEKKTSLKILSLFCQMHIIDDQYIKKIEDVFAGIKLPQNLTILRIHYFLGKQLPDHMTSDRLRELTSLHLSFCLSFTRLPSLGDLPKLQRLDIDILQSVVELGSEFLGSLKFPKLQGLFLRGMTKLERMFDVEEGAFPCLVKLSISGCPKLNSLGEGWNHATCLETLEVKFVQNLKSIENLTSISELRISTNKTLSSVKELPSLKIMKIDTCPALKDVRNVGELNYLDITDLEMKTLPRWLENITPPKKLSVYGSEVLVLGIQESVENQNIIKKCLHAEVSSRGGSYSYNSNLTGSSGASSSKVNFILYLNKELWYLVVFMFMFGCVYLFMFVDFCRQ